MFKIAPHFSLQNLEDHMILIEGGEFEMGGESWLNGTKTIHRVRLNDFWLCRYLVTQALWQAVMGDNSSHFKGPDRPVEQVSWHDCQSFIDKLNRQTERQYCLPTEAQWEFAARGGKAGVPHNYRYSGSNDLCQVAWWAENSQSECHPVGLKQPNALGLYDMSGNVREWCADWYSDEYYQECHERGIVSNPLGITEGSSKVVRGGAWDYFNSSYFRPSYRIDFPPTFRSNRIGFRLSG